MSYNINHGIKLMIKIIMNIEGSNINKIKSKITYKQNIRYKIHLIKIKIIKCIINSTVYSTLSMWFKCIKKIFLGTVCLPRKGMLGLLFPSINYHDNSRHRKCENI